MNLLIENGAEPSNKIFKARNTLYKALEANVDDNRLQLLIEHGAKPTCDEILNLAIEKKVSDKALNTLIACHSQPNNSTVKTENTLYKAIKVGVDDNRLRLLIDHGAKPTCHEILPDAIIYKVSDQALRLLLNSCTEPYELPDEEWVKDLLVGRLVTLPLFNGRDTLIDQILKDAINVVVSSSSSCDVQNAQERLKQVGSIQVPIFCARDAFVTESKSSLL